MTTFKNLWLPLLASLVLGVGYFGGNAHGSTITDFSGLILPTDAAHTQRTGGAPSGNFWNGSDSSGGFTSRGVAFPNSYTDWGGGVYSWSGWAYSNVNDTTTDGFGNQYAAVTGSGINGPGSTYAVACQDTWGGTLPTITLPAPTTVLSADITNTTYAYLSMLKGQDYPAKQFTDTDWFMLTISGFDVNGQPTGTPVEFNLAQGMSFVTDWTTVDLASLGNDVKSLQFSLTSSDNGQWGMNTPAYFALGDLSVATVPEPSTLALLCCAGMALAVCGTRRRSSHPRAVLDTTERG